MPDASAAIVRRRPPIAIIGAGVAGLTAARLLSQTMPVQLFEAAAVPGGRLATCQIEGHSFDHGAQFFTPRHPRFLAEVRRLQEQDLVVPWLARFVEIREGHITTRRQWNAESAHYVGTSGMAAIAAAWSDELDLHLGRRVTGLRHTTDGVYLFMDKGADQGPFEFVILALPPRTTADLLPAGSCLQHVVNAPLMKGCFALMLGMESLEDVGFDAAIVKDAVISWISVTESRPGHRGPPGIVALASNAWADAHHDADHNYIQAKLTEALYCLFGRQLHPLVTGLHHWPQANSGPVRNNGPLLDPVHHIALCGDWTRQGRVEAAFLSGAQTADMVDTMLNPHPGGSVPLHANR
ncbi:MAG: FAD-dependent oxidoreductase [Niveispirillum sp.]|nr:FAD-dependent oxidoreductase [Niveispirillum sp.]